MNDYEEFVLLFVNDYEEFMEEGGWGSVRVELVDFGYKNGLWYIV